LSVWLWREYGLDAGKFWLLDSEDLVLDGGVPACPAASPTISKGQRDWNPILDYFLINYAWLYKHGL
jgi:hypothetical protein